MGRIWKALDRFCSGTSVTWLFPKECQGELTMGWKRHRYLVDVPCDFRQHSLREMIPNWTSWKQNLYIQFCANLCQRIRVAEVQFYRELSIISPLCMFFKSKVHSHVQFIGHSSFPEALSLMIFNRWVTLGINGVNGFCSSRGLF